jgi:hypothetical protein
MGNRKQAYNCGVKISKSGHILRSRGMWEDNIKINLMEVEFLGRKVTQDPV